MSVWHLTEEHYLFRQSVAKWVQQQLEPHLVEMEEAYETDRRFLKALGSLGFLSATLSEEQGGIAGDFTMNAILLEEIAKAGSQGVAQLIKQHILALSLLAESNNHSLSIVKKAAAGEIVLTYAITDVKKQSGTLRTNIQNCVNGLMADYALVQDRTTSTIYVVDLENTGVTREKQVYQLGWRTANLANLNIDRVEPIQLIHMDESKQEIWRASHDVLDSVIAYGTVQCAFERAKSYTQQRIQFGGPLTQFQVVRHKLVDIAIEREKLKHFVYSVLDEYGRGNFCVLASLLKVSTKEILPFVTDTAQQVHGGNGYMMEYDVQRLWRDSEMYCTIETDCSDDFYVIGKQLIVKNKEAIG